MSFINNSARAQATTPSQLTGSGPVKATGNLGNNTVQVANNAHAPAPQSGIGTRIATFFRSLGAFFSSLGSRISNFFTRAPQAHAPAAAPQTSGKQALVASLKGANVQTFKGHFEGASRADQKTIQREFEKSVSIEGTSANAPAIELLKLSVLKGGEHTCLMSQMKIADWKEAASNKNMAAKNQDATWQATAATDLRAMLLKSGSVEEAGNVIDALVHDLRASDDPELHHLAGILENLRTETADIDGIETAARTAFADEIDGELGRTLGNFFRTDSEATSTSAALMRNLGDTARASMVQSFIGVLQDPANADQVKLLTPSKDNPVNKSSLTTAQMNAVNDLTLKFLDRAFGLATDGGDAFAANYNPTAKRFLSETANTIAGKTQLPQDVRSEAIRSWFSNNFALRDFGPAANKEAAHAGLKDGVTLVSTNIVRIMGGVEGNANLANKMGNDANAAYGAWSQQVGPQVTRLLEKLGMPTAAALSAADLDAGLAELDSIVAEIDALATPTTAALRAASPPADLEAELDRLIAELETEPTRRSAT